jgi:hypothetical protein
MLQRLDLGYALNAHMAQGLTADRGIAVFDSREGNLTNEKLFLVNITRVRDSLELIVDSSDRIERGIVRNTGEKTSALETIGEVKIDRQARAAGAAGAAPGGGSPGTSSGSPHPPSPAPEPQGPLPPGMSPDRTRDADAGNGSSDTRVRPEREPAPEQYNVPLPERDRDWGL